MNEKDTFKFGASKVYHSDFAVWAWFSVEKKWFSARVAIVPCEVPLLFSQRVLAGLGMKLDVAAYRADLGHLDLVGVKLTKSVTGHPALVVSCFPDREPPKLDVSTASEIWIPGREVYMACAASAPLFFPKKLPMAIQNMLMSEEIVQGATFFAWWKQANQSRDFWVETDDEMVRVHVCPRKDFFNLTLWNTTLVDLKQKLLDSLSEDCIVEFMPCLGEGVEVQMLKVDWRSDQCMLPAVPHCLWIGRSRFLKIKNKERAGPPHASCSSLAMEDVEGRAHSGAAGDECGGASILDSARTSGHGGGAKGGRVGARCQTSGGVEQDESVSAEGGSGEVGDPMPNKITRGVLMKLIRDCRATPAQTVLPFGKFRGWMYSEVPQQYMAWAVEEVKASLGADDDLVRFATWSKDELERRIQAKAPAQTCRLAKDPEALAKVPPPSLETMMAASSAGSDTSWQRIRTSRKGRREPEMEEEVESENPAEEIRSLERRLEALKRMEKNKNMR